MSKNLYFLCWAVLLVSLLSPSVMAAGGAVAYFQPGFCLLSAGNLNDVLSQADYPELGGFFFNLGGGGHMILNRLLLGGEGQKVMLHQALANDNYVALDATYGLFNIGFVALRPGNFRIYPLLGVGGGTINLTLKGDELPEGFANVPGTGTWELSKKSLIFNVGLGADYLFNLSGEEMDKTVLVLGLRLGYQYAPKNEIWYVEDDLYSGPPMGLSGFYFRFSIGGGALDNL